MMKTAMLEGVLCLGLALPAAAQERDKDREYVKRMRVTESLCYSAETSEDRDRCENSFAIVGMLIACISLYRADEGTRLECYDDRALGALRGYKKVLEQRDIFNE